MTFREEITALETRIRESIDEHAVPGVRVLVDLIDEEQNGDPTKEFYVEADGKWYVRYYDGSFEEWPDTYGVGQLALLADRLIEERGKS